MERAWSSRVLALSVIAGFGAMAAHAPIANAAFPPPHPAKPIKIPWGIPTITPDTPVDVPEGAQPWMMSFIRGCRVTYKSGFIATDEDGPNGLIVLNEQNRNQCSPYHAQTSPPRTPAGVYSNEPSLPPRPPLPPDISVITLPGIDLDGDGAPDIESQPASNFSDALTSACDNAIAEGISWGSAGDKLIINGMGGGGDPQLSPGEIAGPCAVNADSILVANGFKVSDNADVVVQLPCTSFVLTRNFTGEKEWPLGGANLNSAGSGWTMSFDTGIHERIFPVSYGRGSGGNDPARMWENVNRWNTTGDGFEYMGQVVVATSPIRDSVMFTNHRWYRSDDGGEPPALPSSSDGSRKRNVREFFPVGPRMQRLEAGFWHVTVGTTTVYRPVWILKDPGGGTSIFFRKLVNSEETPSGWTTTQSAAEAASGSAAGLEDYPEGALWQQIDRGGNPWTYYYRRPSLNGTARGKLTSIVLHGVADSDTSTKAVIDVDWYDYGDTSLITGDVVGRGAVRSVSVRRPYMNGSTRNWFFTDVVYYDYFGTTKWLRSGGSIMTRLPASENPSNDLGGRDDDLIQVIRYTALNQPSYDSETGGVGAPSTVKWHTAITQYRYKHLGPTETPIEQRNRQIKMVLNPGQIERIARLMPASFSNAVFSAWDSADTARPSARLEAVAEELLTKSDTEVLIAGSGGAPDRQLKHFADRYTAYYEDADPSYRTFLGRVKSEYTMPGEYGHTRLVNYGYDQPEQCPLDCWPLQTCVATKAYEGTVAEGVNITYPFLLQGHVSREWEYIANSDAQAGATGNPWKLKRVSRHRSEDRLLQEAAIVNGFGPDGDVGSFSVNFLVVATPVTVRSSVHEVTDTSPYEDTNTTNDTGVPLGRMWVDETVTDGSLRTTRSFPMGSLAITQPSSSMSDYVKWSIDRLRFNVVSGAGPSASGATGTYYLEQTPTSSTISTETAVQYAANTQVTSRPYERYASQPFSTSSPAWQATARSTFRNDWFASTVMADTARPDLSTAQERFAVFAAVNSAPSDPNSIERTETAYTFSTVYNASVITQAVSKSERELTAEFGDGSTSTIDTTYHFSGGQITQVDQPGGGLVSYQHHPINGQTTKVTISDGASTPQTIVTTSTFDLSGHQIAVKSPNGDAAAYLFTLAVPPAVDLTSPTTSGANLGALPLELTSTTSFASTDVPVLCVVQWPRAVSSTLATGPARVDWMSVDQKVLRSSIYTLTSTGASAFDGSVPLTSLSSSDLDKEVSRKMGVYMGSGLAQRTYSWPFTPDLLPTGKSEEVYTTQAIYNGDGAAIKTTDALGNISQPEFDGPGRTVRTKVGITTTSTVSRTIFDGETSTDGQLNTQGIGSSQVTLTIGLPDGRDFVSGDPTRAKRTWYDQRGRPIITCAAAVVTDASNVVTYVPVGPYAVTQYDNLDRPVCTFTVANDSSVSIGDVKDLAKAGISTLIASTNVSSIKRTEYSQRGLVFRESSYVSPLKDPTPPSGMSDYWSVARHLFDVRGRQVVATAAGQPVSKTEYDLLGRVVHVETTAEDYSDLTHLRTYGYGRVLEKTTNTYIDGTTLVKRVTKTVRGHDNDTATGTSMGSSVTTYAETVYDVAGRATGTLNYGTNNTSGDTFSSGSAPSGPSAYQATVSTGRISLSSFTGTMRAETFYDARGLASSTTTWLTDSPSTITRTNKQLYDSLGRSYASIENSSGSTLPTIQWDTGGTPARLRWKVASWPSGSASDQDRVTSTVFDAAGHSLKRTAHVRGSSGEGTCQTTGYRYTWTSADTPGTGVMNSPVPLHGLLYQTSFPDDTTGEPSTAAADQVYFSYNAVGEQTATTDQRGVIHESIRDGAGRTVADKASNFPTLTIPGAPSSVAITGVTGTWTLPSFAVDNHVQQISTRYDRFGRIAAVYSHSTPVDYSTTISGTSVDKGLVASGESESALDGSSPPNYILNYVRYQYDRAGDAIRIRQSVDGIDSTGLSGLPTKPGAQQLRSYFGYTVASSSLTFTAASGGGSGSEVIRRLDSVLYPSPSDPTSDDAGLTQPAHFNGVTMDYGSSGSIAQTMGRVSTVVLRSDWPGTYSGTEAQLKKNLINYSYVGVGTRAITDLPQVNIQSDRTFGDGRTRSTSGTWSYAGWERFGRLRLQSWVSTGTNASNAVPAWFQERFVHDLGGRRTQHYQDRTDSLFPDDDWRGTYDGLDRLTESLRGNAGSGSSFFPAVNSKAWVLDELGNFTSVKTGDTPTSAPASTEARAHNATNELTQIGSGSSQKNRCYDAAGNLVLVTTGTSSTPTLAEIMVYDAWNRLVQVSRPVPSTQIVSGSSDYLDAVSNRYNGLSWRTAEWRRSAQRSTGGGTAASLAMARWFTYTGSWQVAQEHLWKPWGTGSSKQFIEQQYYGLRGTDDVVYRRIDGGNGTDGLGNTGDGVPDRCFASDLPTIGYATTPGRNLDGGYYQLTDSQFSVVAHVDATTGLLSRRYAYDSYGKLESHSLTDVDGDGSAGTTTDDDDLWGAVSVGSSAGDFNRDGVANSTDWDDYLSAKDLATNVASAPAAGVLGWGDMVEPRIGYAGYVRAEWTTTVGASTNLKVATTGGGANWWYARNRFYDPQAGRWINRDPAGYTDGLSMYLYVRGNPWGLVDPTGLQPGLGLGPVPAGPIIIGSPTEGPEQWACNGVVRFGVGLAKSLFASPRLPAPGDQWGVGSVVEGPFHVGNALYTAFTGNKTDEHGIPTGETATPQERIEGGVENGLNALLILEGARGTFRGGEPPVTTETPAVAEPKTAPTSTAGLSEPTNVGTGADLTPKDFSRSITGAGLDPPEPVVGPTRDAAGRLRNADGTFAKDPTTPAKPVNDPSTAHGNTLNDAPAWLYRRFNKDNVFQKWGITDDLNGRYSKNELNGDRLEPFDYGPRRIIAEIERSLVEHEPGPMNKEPWAGAKRGK